MNSLLLGVFVRILLSLGCVWLGIWMIGRSRRAIGWAQANRGRFLLLKLMDPFSKVGESPFWRMRVVGLGALMVLFGLFLLISPLMHAFFKTNP